MIEINYLPGVVYTETLVYSSPEQFAQDAPYQVAILSPEAGARRFTVRILGDKVHIGDRIEFQEERDGVPYYCKA